MENSESPTEAQASPGELLRAAREALGISQREMADRLNWMPAYIVAVEENRFEVLRGAAFVSGYLRAYAKLVEVPEDTLMVAYAAFSSTDPATEAKGKRTESRVPQVQKKGIAIPAGVAIVVLVVFLLWFWRGEEQLLNGSADSTASEYNEIDAPRQAEVLVQQKSLPMLVAPGAATDGSSAGLAEASGPAVGIAATGPGEAPGAGEAEAEDLPPDSAAAGIGLNAEPESADAGSPAAVAAAPAAISSPAAAPGSVSTASEISSGPNVITVVAGDAADAAEQRQLQFRFGGDCWLEVRNAANELIYADLRRGGDVLNLSGLAPFKVLLGDARFVELEYQGQVVPIQRRPGRSVANFSVGEP